MDGERVGGGDVDKRKKKHLMVDLTRLERGEVWISMFEHRPLHVIVLATNN
ncbi:hypothetical protein MTR_3g099165 [Medicago truncatula]|uniref:Uncharacterized protein n=1 Tax=Medicago truncatula TaxID=3880 RepID=A0A072V1J0_MEDTR|nr:hypothetical protein MTR_3g099165 [Medicago truncatula]